MDKAGSYQAIKAQWERYLIESADIASRRHIDFFDGVKNYVSEIPDKNFMIQREAGFYRLRLINVVDGVNNTEYRVNYHVFGPSQTHLHSHGYSGYSHVLDGELYYENYNCDRLSQKQLEDLFLSLDLVFRHRTHGEKIKHEVSRELYEGLIGVRDSFSFNTMLFAAYLGGGDDEDFGSFTKPEDVMSIVRTHLGNMYYTLKSADSGIVKTGETYGFTDLQAHRVTVPEFARTLFITKKKIDKICPEGNFEMFPDQIPEFTSSSPEQSSIRRYITESLET